jgi:hypothetical protein
MRFMKVLAASLIAAATLSLAATSHATNYTLWIHGRNTSQSTKVGNYADFSYWGSAASAAGVNKKAVNWDGVSKISTSNGKIRNALDCYCTGSNWCYIAVHSAGDLQIGYALALHGASSRSIKNASPDATGVCGNAGGTQTGWNIKWVDLKTSVARSLYNHNTTQGKWFYMFAGAKGTAYSGTLPGQDDEAVAYHSTGGLSSTGSLCNPGDLFCGGTLEMGTTASNGIAKWSYHTVEFRDDSESYDHYSAGAWGGIVGVVRSDMVNFAK